jgi:transcriptional antiterminator RfaH
MLKDLDWYLVYTKPRSESEAKINLERQGFEVLLPKLREQRIVRKRLQWVEEPLFKRYLFLGGPRQSAWNVVRSTRGAINFVRFGGTMTLVPPTLIESLVQMGEVIEAGVPMFTRGQKVRIGVGAFTGLEAIFQMSDGHQRAQVLLYILGVETTVTIDVEALVPV